MEQIAGWVAPVSTTIAACMTAANLGPRVTGWGFIVFSVGAVAWALVGLATGQGNLVWQNAILLLIDLIGIWRWLGREARYESGAARATARSRRAPATPDLFPASRFSGCPVIGVGGAVIGSSVDAMTECGTGRINYLVVREGGLAGVGERLHALPWSDVKVEGDGFRVDLDGEALAARPALLPDAWPRSA